MKSQIKYRSLPGIVMTAFGKEYYLVRALKLPADRDRYLISMNEVAAFYWKLLDRPRTRSELIEALSEEYEVADPASAARDLDRLLSEWTGAGCVEAVHEN